MTFAQSMDFLMSKSRPVVDTDVDIQAVPYILAFTNLALELLGLESL